MAQKPPHNPSLRELAVNLESKGSDEIHHDIVIVPRVEADVSPRFSYSADYIQGLVTAERCHLDGHDILDLGEPASEFVRKCAPAHRRLQVEANDG